MNKTLTAWLLNTNVGESAGATAIGGDLAGVGAPKLNFLFTAQISLDYAAPGFSPALGSANMEAMQFQLKSATRPNIAINYEDVNYYGYRAKVATKTSFGTVKLTFYEDTRSDNADINSTVWDIIRQVVPLAALSGDVVSTAGDSVGAAAGDTGGSTGVGAYRRADGPINWIRVYHHFIQHDIGSGSEQYRTTVYTYINPKIESIEYNDLDMSSSEASTISITFAAEAITMRELPYDAEPSLA